MNPLIKKLENLFHEHNIIAWKKVKENFNNVDEELLFKKIKSLIDQKILDEKALIICPECSSTLGTPRYYKESNLESIQCPYCDKKVEIIPDNAMLFFFLRLRESFLK